MKKQLTCIECPVGCTVQVEVENGRAVSVTGNSCPRGKAYAESEVIDPKRVVTSTVRLQNGKLLPVKTSAPVPKAEMGEVMAKINALHPTGEIGVGEILLKDIADGVDLVATDRS